jgi:hypothetical protein
LKNDTCHIEQKNWAVVRRLVGYDRLELPALPALERIHDLARDYVNFLHPLRKLVSKTRRRSARHPPLRWRTNTIPPTSGQRTFAAGALRSDSYVRQP